MHIPTAAYALNPAGAPATVDMCRSALSEHAPSFLIVFLSNCTRGRQKSLRKPLSDPHALFFAEPSLRGARRVKERSDWKPADRGIDLWSEMVLGFSFLKKTR